MTIDCILICVGERVVCACVVYVLYSLASRCSKEISRYSRSIGSSDENSLQDDHFKSDTSDYLRRSIESGTEEEYPSMPTFKNHFNSLTNDVDDEDEDDDDDDSLSEDATGSHSVHRKRGRAFTANEFTSPPSKKSRTDTAAKVKVIEPILDGNKGKSIMERMGYRAGKGLGKNAQGRVEPVEMSKQRGRRGLGLDLPGLDAADIEWDSSKEVVSVKEDVEWLDGSDLEPLTLETLHGWVQEGAKDTDISKMTDFVDEDILQKILNGKSAFDKLTSEEMLRARTRSNPFETIRNAIFLNRAAVKMANMDSIFDFMFTSPKTEDGSPLLDPKQDLLYFADVCAGPGGFSEYVLWRTHWRSKGFGFTLRGENDFKLGDFFAGPPETFEAYYGVKDDGNVFDLENIESFEHFVKEETDGKGVHFMMADGGFSVEGQENIQEILSKQLYLCQCIVALSIVRDYGHFVCKLFDLFSPFSAGLIYLMYRAFKSVCIFKPNTSRPANSERYIVCKFRRPDSDFIRKYLKQVNRRLIELETGSPGQDVTHLVPMEVLFEDHQFYDYLRASNNILGARQITGLEKIVAFCRDVNLIEHRQADIRRECLTLWKIPDKGRKMDRTSQDEAAKKILKDYNVLSIKHKKLRACPLEEVFKSCHDWLCLPVSAVDLHFYLGMGRSKIFRWNPHSFTWERESSCPVVLSPGTLVYGSIVTELKGEGRSQTKSFALHVIDAFAIAYENISRYNFFERLRLLQMYEKALSKRHSLCHSPVRVNVPVPLSNVESIIKSLTYRYSKSNQPHLVIEDKKFTFHPAAILFFKTTKAPWTKCVSKSTGYSYYFNNLTRESLYEKDRPVASDASTEDCLASQHMWEWEEGVGFQREDPVEGVLHKDQLLSFVKGVH